MKKKSNTPHPSLFSPELGEIVKRSKTTEPELTETIARGKDAPQAQEKSNTTQAPCGITTAVGITREELRAMVSETVKQELRAVLGGEVHQLSRGTRPRRVVKKTFSIEQNLWERFCALFPEAGMRSAHVNKALDLYISLKDDNPYKVPY